ncbi:MAG: glutathione S-transferase N-terminal domain-containing protein [Actinomycetota bacterium]|nr:glutathione S-transferase N-terminal domain-containing protein [Actinomycetota bacterium]
MVTIYWREGCVFCTRLRWTLRMHGLDAEWINIHHSEEAAAYVRSVADGNETVPTVVINGRGVVNPSPAEVVAAIRADVG